VPRSKQIAVITLKILGTTTKKVVTWIAVSQRMVCPLALSDPSGGMSQGVMGMGLGSNNFLVKPSSRVRIYMI
jgi:hypothetical protein